MIQRSELNLVQAGIFECSYVDENVLERNGRCYGGVTKREKNGWFNVVLTKIRFKVR